MLRCKADSMAELNFTYDSQWDGGEIGNFQGGGYLSDQHILHIILQGDTR